MNKAYSRINWQNAPSEATALNETNLNKMDSAIDTIDARVVAHDTRLDNAEYAIGQAGDSITALQGDVSTLEGTVSTQGSAITALQNGKVDKISGKGLCDIQEFDTMWNGINTGTWIGRISYKTQSGSSVVRHIYNGVEVDSALSDSSTNPVQNKAIKMVLDEKVDKVSGKGLSSLSGLGITTSANTGNTIADILAIDQNGNEYHNYIKNGVEVDSALSSESENPVQNKAVTTELENKADVDGNYEDMAVGQLLSNTFKEDSFPYNFRTSGGALEIGDREYDTLVGGTVAFNQLVYDGNFNSLTYWSSNGNISLDNHVVTVNQTRQYGGLITGTKIQLAPQHIILIKFTLKSYSAQDLKIGYGDNVNFTNTKNCSISTTWNDYYYLHKIPNTVDTNNDRVFVRSELASDWIEYYVAKAQYFDLTQMFGSTIADYIYSLEQATAGSGVAYFRSLFPKDYYAYNAGQLMSVKALSHKMVGFNQWDEEWESGQYNAQGEPEPDASRIRSKNYVPVLPSTKYYVKAPSTCGIRFYDVNKQFLGSQYNITPNNTTFTTPAGAYYLRFSIVNTTFYANNACINLHLDGERDGEYEAYSEHIYPLDSDLELRGIPKLDANNNLYYDGDTYESDGTVTRKYGIVDLGTLTWELSGQIFKALLPNGYTSTANTTNCVCPKYIATASVANGNMWMNQGNINIVDSAYQDAATFKTAMSGVYLVYELATPTTETADTFENPQLVDNWGTEEYTDSRAVQIPVGHITKYPPDLKAKLESAPDSPASDGDYILRHNNGVNSYVAYTKELPSAPTTDGTYVLKATVSSGVATLSWVVE